MHVSTARESEMRNSLEHESNSLGTSVGNVTRRCAIFVKYIADFFVKILYNLALERLRGEALNSNNYMSTCMFQIIMQIKFFQIFRKLLLWTR